MHTSISKWPKKAKMKRKEKKKKKGCGGGGGGKKKQSTVNAYIDIKAFHTLK